MSMAPCYYERTVVGIETQACALYIYMQCMSIIMALSIIMELFNIWIRKYCTF